MPMFKTPPAAVTTRKDRTVNCIKCVAPDNDEMVQCDICDRWCHFECANVKADIANKDWVCSVCSLKCDMPKDAGKISKAYSLPTVPSPEQRKSKTIGAVDGKKKGSSGRSQHPSLELKRLEEEKRLEMKKIALEAEQKRIEAENIHLFGRSSIYFLKPKEVFAVMEAFTVLLLPGQRNGYKIYLLSKLMAMWICKLISNIEAQINCPQHN